MADNSRQAMQLKAFQGVARGTYPTHGAGEGPLQRKALVYVHTNNADKKAIVSRGKVEDFKNGTNAGTKGWVGVKSYRARYQIDSEDEEYQNKNSVGPLQNDFTNPESGHVLGKQNGGDGADPENVFGQDGGTNNGVYKSFEIDMRKKLDLYDDEDDVGFVSYLAGDDIKQGTIADEGLSDAGSISSEDDLW